MINDEFREVDKYLKPPSNPVPTKREILEEFKREGAIQYFRLYLKDGVEYCEIIPNKALECLTIGKKEEDENY